MNTQLLKRWLPVSVTALLVAVAWLSGVLDVFNLELIKAHRQQLHEAVLAHPILCTAAFVLAYATAVALSLPVASALTLVGGFLFGRWLGAAAVVIGATAGSTAVFLIARSAVGSTLRERAGPLYRKVAANMEHNAVGYMLFMRLVPVFPFFLANIVPALFNVRLLPFALTTFFGIIPGTLVYVNAGQALASVNSPADLASPGMVIAFTFLGVFALIPTLFAHIKGRMKSVAVLLAGLLAVLPAALRGTHVGRLPEQSVAPPLGSQVSSVESEPTSDGVST